MRRLFSRGVRHPGLGRLACAVWLAVFVAVDSAQTHCASAVQVVYGEHVREDGRETRVDAADVGGHALRMRTALLHVHDVVADDDSADVAFLGVECDHITVHNVFCAAYRSLLGAVAWRGICLYHGHIAGHMYIPHSSSLNTRNRTNSRFLCIFACKCV